MANIIERLNKQQAQRAESMMKNADDPYAIYKERLKRETKFEITFPLSDSTGNLYTIDENKIKIVLPMEKLQATDRYYSKELRGAYVGIKTLEVVIDRIDEEKGVVYLKSGRTTESIVRAIEDELYREIRRRWSLKENGETPEPYPVYGTVVSVDADRQNATVRLFNQNIYGVVHVSKWSSSYIRSLPEGIEDTDTPLQFDLIGTDRIGERKYFRLSGENYGNDAWRDIPEEIFEEGAVITVECVEAPDDKRHWWGKCEGIGVELVGNYTDKFKIEVGRSYLCTIKRTKSENHTLVVTPFKYLRKEGESKEDVAYISKQDVKELLQKKKEEAEKKENEKEVVETEEKKNQTKPRTTRVRKTTSKKKESKEGE